MENELLKSVQVGTGTRVYYFDVYKDRKDKHYLAISETPTEKSPGQKRGKIFIHSANIERFRDAVNAIADFIGQESVNKR